MTSAKDLLCPNCNPKFIPEEKKEPWQDKCDEIKAAYDKLAQENPIWYPSEQFVKLFGYVMREMGDTDSPRILDVGCGSGFWEWMTCRFGPEEFEIQAFDLSPASVFLAKRKCPDLRVKFWVGNLYCHKCVRKVIPGQFDQVWMFEVLQHIPKEYWLSVVSNYWGWLKPGGLFLIIDKDAEHPASQKNLEHYRTKDVAPFFKSVVNYMDIEELCRVFVKAGAVDGDTYTMDDWLLLKVPKP